MTAALVAVVVAASLSAVTAPGPAAAHEGHDHDTASGPTLPTGFSDVEVIGGITEPISVAFAADQTAFVALKTGTVKAFDRLGEGWETNATATDVITTPLTTEVNNYWDRGLTGIEVDPAFPTRPYLYLNYTYNRDPRTGAMPAWGNPAEQYDQCPVEASEDDQPGAGCIVMDRVTRITLARATDGWVMRSGSEKELFANGCFHFPSHGSGDVVFGPDGKLYASLGDGASFNTEDYGQFNGNPCGDPVDEGGALRAQDVRTPGDPMGYDGSIVRLDPDTGNPQLVAYGHRNPWRLAFRPGTSELWNNDVGGSGWEELNRLPNAPTAAAVNRGWPCYEGSPSGSTRNDAWDLLDKPLCESLYAQGPGAVQAPAFSYQTRLNAGPLTPGEDCEYSTSSVSGVAFTTTETNYPAAYENALYFSDYARQCIWRLSLRADGTPDPASITTMAQRSGTPVDLLRGPGGDIYYVDYGIVDDAITEGAGGVHRLTYNAPVAVIAHDLAPDTEPGANGLAVRFSGLGSSDPLGGALSYSWDLNDDGRFGDRTGPTPTWTYTTRGVKTARLQVSTGGRVGTTSVDLQVGKRPTITSMTPGSDLAWVVGQKVDFAGSATDYRGTAIGASQLTWRLQIEHCPGACHSHPLQTFAGVARGSFETPNHEYPSHLRLFLTAKDADGLTSDRSVRLDPKTATLTFASSPAGLPLAVSGVPATTQQTFIVGSVFTVSAPATQQRGPFSWTFAGWSDGGAATHQVTAPATAQSYVASYAPVTGQVSADTKRKGLQLRIDGALRPVQWIATLPVGTVVRIEAPKKQKKKGVRYVFAKWQDGSKDPLRTLTVGSTPIDLTAIYKRKRR